MTKEEISKMSTDTIKELYQTYRNKIAHMTLLNTEDLEIYAYCEAELKSRKDNGNC